MKTPQEEIKFWRDAHDRACALLNEQESKMADMKAAIATAEAIWHGEEYRMLVRFAVALVPLEPDTTKLFERAQAMVNQFKVISIR